MSMKVGIQLYSVRDAMAQDPIETCKTVAGIGYKYLEFANHNGENDHGVGFGVSAEELNEALAGSGAQFISGHIRPLNDDNINEVLEFNKKIGSKYLCIPSDFFSSKEELIEKCKEYNRIGAICREAGISYLYHNHHHEFQKFDGKSVLELIAENTDPENFGFEIDTFWVMRAGEDPIALMKKLGSRVKLIHQKDFSKDSSSPLNLFSIMDTTGVLGREVFSYNTDDAFAEIGTGILPIQDILNCANELGSVEYVILEQDKTKLDQMESIKVSMESFKKFDGVNFD